MVQFLIHNSVQFVVVFLDTKHRKARLNKQGPEASADYLHVVRVHS